MCETAHTPPDLQHLLRVAGLEGKQQLAVGDLVALARVAQAYGGERGIHALFDQLGLHPDEPPISVRSHPIVL